MILIHSNSTVPAFNLATEEYLFKETTQDILFIYSNDPSVIVGSNQAIRNEVNIEFCSQENIKVVRRMSGGGTVYHDSGNLNYCFITNKKADKFALNNDFLHPIVAALNTLDIPVIIGKRKDLWLPGNFKVSGTASSISKTRELHHGTLLYNTDLEMLQKALLVKVKDETLKAIASVPSPVKNICTYLHDNNLMATETSLFFQGFIDALFKILNIYEISNLSDTDIESIIKLKEEKFDTIEWTFRK